MNIKKSIFTTVIIILATFIFFLYIFNNNSKNEFSDTDITSPQEEVLNTTNIQNSIIKKILPEEFKQKIDFNDHIVIDIRTENEYITDRITIDALNIDFYQNDFKANLNNLDKTKKYLYYCNSGNRSSQATQIFKELGFKQVYELDGGIKNWRLNHPTVK